MPFANGVYGHSAGQAYSRAKSSGAMKSEGGDDKAHGSEDKEQGPQQGSIVHVKHHGGGKFSVKHEDGSVTKHETPEEMHGHLDQHFGVNEPDAEKDVDSDYDADNGMSGHEDYEGGDALKSILG